MKQTKESKAYWRRRAAVNQDILVEITDEAEIEKIKHAVAEYYKELDLQLDSDRFNKIVKAICEAWRSTIWHD